MDDLDNLTQQLTEARREGEPDNLAAVLVAHANALVQAGQIEQARLELDEAAVIHRQRGRVYDQARCTQFAATLCRFEGKLNEATKRANQAARLAEPGTPLAVAAATELGEIALARNNGPAAVEAYKKALNEGQVAGLIETARSSLLRKRAIALANSNRYQEAASDLTEAYNLLQQVGDYETATRVLIEKATALQHGDYVTEAEQVSREAIQIAEETNDHHALADLYLFQSAQAVDQAEIDTALSAAYEARNQALSAVAPMSYIGAAMAISELAEIKGDRLTAYEALVVGWVTLSDLLGRDTAKATFKPKLLELQEQWGAEAFAEIKTTYEARRKAEKKMTEGSEK